MNQRAADPRDYVVAAPYPEGAISAIARGLYAQSRLTQLLLPSRAVARSIARITGARRRVQSQTAARLRRGESLITESTREIAPLIELNRLAIRATSLSAARSAQRFDELKPHFDAAVARRVPEGYPGIFIGMPAAAGRTFRKVRPTAICVLHEVDAPPHAHNRALLEHYPRWRVENEIVPPRIAQLIEDELRTAHVVLTPSSIVSGQVRELDLSAQIVQVPYGVDFDQFTPTVGLRRPSRPRIVYVGQVSMRKGLPFLLQAADGLPVDVKIVGPVVNRDCLRKMPANFEYLGVLAHSELSREFALADAFVFPSIEDNFALALVEAAGSGLPVITTSAVGAEPLIPEPQKVVVPAGDSRALREALAAVEPLADDRRVEIAERIRGSDVLDWVGYASHVIDELDAIRRPTVD